MATERWLSSKAFELEQGASALSQARDAWADKAAQGHANITDFSDVLNAVVANQLSMGSSVIAFAQALREDKTHLVQHIREALAQQTSQPMLAPKFRRDPADKCYPSTR